MLRIGKNAKDQEDNDHHSSQRPEVPDYSTPKTYPSYQSTSAETKPAVEMTTSGASSRAMAIIHGTINGDIIATQRLELGRAAKVNGNIQTPSLVIEQGAVFEGSCKMVQMTAAVDKAKKDKRDDQPLDTSRMKPIPTDAGAKSTDIPAATNVVN
jgi:hypothetical protein